MIYDLVDNTSKKDLPILNKLYNLIIQNESNSAIDFNKLIDL